MSLNLIETKKWSLVKKTNVNLSIKAFIETKADYFIEMPTYALARAIGVSKPSLSRFAQACGFENLQALKIYLAARQARFSSQAILAQGKNLSANLVAENIYTHYEYSIKETFRQLDITNLEKWATFLRRFDHLYIFGLGNNQEIAEYFALNLTKLGLHAHALASIHTFFALAPNLTVKTHLIIISKTFKTLEIKKIARILEKNVINYSVITKNTNLKNYPCAQIIEVASLGQKRSIGALGSKISFYLIIDIVFALLINLVDPEYKKFKLKDLLLSNWNQGK